MDAASSVAVSQAQTQAAVATKMMKMNADSSKEFVSMIDQAAETLKQATLPAGSGQSLDLTV